MKNHTKVTVFILAGLTDDPLWKVVLFIFLLITYLLSITGNLIIITLTLVDAHLKTPMYFFLRNFSFLEISYTTTCIPKLLATMTTGDKSILYNSCAIQVFFAFLLGASEFYLLAAMSYDRYVAICKPLHYMTIMNKKVCVQLVLSCWLAGFLVIFPPLLLGLNLDFCASNIVDHFYCDTTPLMQLSCRHTALGDDGLCLGFGDTLSHIGNGDNFLHLHCHDDSKNPFNQPEKESFLYVLFSHDCDIPFVWQLHLHVC
ncbi:Olfactory receptor 6C74 [Lemmus lemmus]